MQEVTSDGLVFEFDDDWAVSKFDDWSYYRNQFIRISDGIKAVDLLACAPDKTTWMIEVKDYRLHRRTKLEDLGSEIARKVLFSLAAMLPASLSSSALDEKAFAKRILRSKKLRVVLHLEQPQHPTKLRPQIIDPAHIQLKLRQILKCIDAHVIVVEVTNMRGLPWSVR